MKRLFVFSMILLAWIGMEARTLVVYYSYTNNVHTIVADLQTQLNDADVVRVEPAEEGLDYAANNYALGSALIAAIRENPDDASSYPAIKPIEVDIESYDEVIVAAPLWWSSMAAPMQTFLFANGDRMSGKRIGLIVSSASSGISGVEADARRLIPEGNFVSPSLWIRSSQTPNCHAMIAEWLEETGLGGNSGVTAIEDAESAMIFRDGILSVEGLFDRLSLYDLSGCLRLVSFEQDTDVSSLPSSVYAACLQNGADSIVRKIFVSGE